MSCIHNIMKSKLILNITAQLIRNKKESKIKVIIS